MVAERKTLGWLLGSVLTFVLVAGWQSLVCGAEVSAGAAPSSAVSSGATASGGMVASDEYIIQVDDILTIEGSPHVEFRARVCRVGQDGTIKMAYLGRVEVAGLTKRQLEEKLEKEYDPKYFKNLVITVDVRIQSFNIVGEVRIPGIKELLIKTTLLTAIGSAGGFTEYADQDKVIVIRNTEGKPTRQIVSCKDILRGRITDDFVIKPNDVIWVPRKGFLGL
jgi:polysaccharide export outer membrane protein